MMPKQNHSAGRGAKSSEFFQADVEKRLDQYQDQPKIPRIRLPWDFKDILVIGDCHFPWVNVATLSLIYQFTEAIKPKRIVQIGDLYDLYSQSKFPRSLNIYTPDQEIEIGRKMASDMWRKLQELSPGAQCIQMLGNHDIRPVLRMKERNPEGERYFSWETFYGDFTFPGVELIKDPRQELDLDGILFMHGYKSKNGDHREHNQASTVTGHSHRGGVTYKPLRDRILWELNAGFCGDPLSKALGYPPQRITNWTQGFGYIDALGPRFIPA